MAFGADTRRPMAFEGEVSLLDGEDTRNRLGLSYNRRKGFVATLSKQGFHLLQPSHRSIF